MLVETSLITGIIAVGVAADRYSTKQAKLRLGNWIGQAKTFDWHAFAADRSWLIYSKLFGSRSASKRFIITSFALYALLCLASFVFLYIFFYATFLAITSVWHFGTGSEQGWWSACMVLGGALYVLANAQTLYFLEILKTAPNFSKFILVAYADVLITISITIFGVPALMALYTYGASSTGSAILALNVDFRQLTDRPASRARTQLNGVHPGNHRSPANELPGGFVVWFGFPDATDDLAQTNADYDAVLDAMNRGQAPGATINERGVIGLSSVLDFGISIVRGQPYRDLVISVNLGDDGSRITTDAFCRNFASGALGRSRVYTSSPRMADVATSLLHACLTRSTVNVRIPAAINYRSLSIARLYRTYLLVSLNDVTQSLPESLESYMAISPYSVIKVEDPSVIWDVYRSYMSIVGHGPAFDQMVLKAYVRQAGGTRAVMHRALPTGTINFAIISTGLFNLIVISVFLLLFPVVKIVGRVEVISRYVNFK